MNIKNIIINLLSKVNEGAYSNIILNEVFKKEKFNSKEKAFITEVFYGVIRNSKYIDYVIGKYSEKIKKEWLKNILRLSIYQIDFMKSDNSGIVWEATELTKKKYGIPVSKFINAILRNYLRDNLKIKENLKNNKRYDIIYSIPNWFLKLLEKEYGENFEQAIRSLKKIPYLSVRVNKLNYSEEEFENFLKENGVNIIKKIETVYYVDSGSIINSEEFKNGKIIAQDASSYLAAKILGAKVGELVLDVCSAPGGKTAVLAENMENKGEIIALDIHQHKIKLIESNMKKLGVDIVKATVLDARNVNKQGRKFDKILVDVPCSGYGVIRKKPEILFNKMENNIEELSNLQFEILNAAADILKDKGELVYSTCTITSQENTENIKKFLEKRKYFKVQKIEIPSQVYGDFDDIGGFSINYKDEILDSFYIVKLIKEGKKC